LKKIKTFLFNGIILTITSFLLRTIGVSFNVYISNKIGPEGVGVYQLVMSVYMFAVTIALSGINLASMRIVSEELAYGYEKNIKKAMTKCIKYSLFFGIISGSILFFSANYISSVWLHNKISAIPFYVISVSLPFVSVSSAITGYFSAIRRVLKSACTQVFEQVIKVILVSYLLSRFMPSGIDFACLSLVLGVTISEFLSFICLYFLYLFDISKYKSNFESKTNLDKRILNISIPIAITSYIRSGLSTLKQILIPLRLEKSGMSCEYALSRYGMINGMVLPIILFPSTLIISFSSLLIPEFAYYNTKKETYKINKSVSYILKVTLIFSTCIVGVFWCFSEELSLVIYNTSEISLYIKILSPLIIFMYLDTIVDSILKGLDKQLSVMGINILDLFVSIGLIYFLLPLYGLIGYIIVLSISEIFNALISFKQLLKTTNTKIDYLNWIIKPISGIIITNIVVNLVNINKNISISSLVVKIIIYILIYFIILVFLKSIEKKDLRYLK